MRSKKHQNRRQVILAAVVALSSVGLVTINGATRIAQTWEQAPAFYAQDPNPLYGPLPLHPAVTTDGKTDDEREARSSATSSDTESARHEDQRRLESLRKEIARAEKSEGLMDKKIARAQANVDKFTKKLVSINDGERKSLMQKRVAFYATTLEDLRQDQDDLQARVQDLQDEIDILSDGGR